jgi:hypothetical protein
LISLPRKPTKVSSPPEEAREYDRFIEFGDIIATLRLKAESQKQLARG